MSTGRQHKKIGDLTQKHRRGSMLQLEKGWNSSFGNKKANSRKSFGNVFAAAATEDEKRAELEYSILQQGSSLREGGSFAEGNGNGWIGGPQESGNSSPVPSDASRKVLNLLKTYVKQHNVSMKDVRIELSRLYPHGELDTINDARVAIKVIGRNQISSADIHAVIKYLDAVGQWRGDRKMRWADLVDYLV